jgi:twitching motility two-component system response regulator PilH
MALVLIADDSLFQRFFLKKIAAGLGHEVLDAGGGRQLLDLALEKKPGLVLMDLNMPEMTGLEVLEAFQERGLAIRSVVITADIQHTTKARCLELGAAGVLHKPAEEEAVRQAILRLLPAS